MKKIISLIFALTLILSVVPVAYAHGGHHGQNAAAPKACQFVDTDKDGVCDNCNKTCEKSPVDENKDGICDHCDEKCDSHRVDADDDGICDNCGKACEGHSRHNGCESARKYTRRHHGGSRGGHCTK